MVDQAKETVSLLAEVNGKYLYAPTRHAVVFEGGGNGNKSVFRALVNVEPFHTALVEIGAKAGENIFCFLKKLSNTCSAREDS